MTERTMAVAFAQLLCGCVAATIAPNVAVRGPALAGAAVVPDDTDARTPSLTEGFDEFIGRVNIVSPYMQGQRLRLLEEFQEERDQAILSFRKMVEANAATKLELEDLDESLRKTQKGNVVLRAKAKRLRGEVERLRNSLKKLDANLTMASEYGVHFPKITLRLGTDLSVLTDLRANELAVKAKDDHARRLKEVLDGPALDLREDNMALLDVGPDSERDVKLFMHAISGVSRLRNQVQGVLKDAAAAKQALREKMSEAQHAHAKEAGVLRARKVALEQKLAQATADQKVLNDAVEFLERERQELLDAKAAAASYVAEVGRRALFTKH